MRCKTLDLASERVPSHLVVEADRIGALVGLELVVAHEVLAVLVEEVELTVDLIALGIDDGEVDVELAAARHGELDSDELVLGDVDKEALLGLRLHLQRDGLGRVRDRDEREEERYTEDQRARHLTDDATAARAGRAGRLVVPRGARLLASPAARCCAYRCTLTRTTKRS